MANEVQFGLFILSEHCVHMIHQESNGNTDIEQAQWKETKFNAALFFY